MTAFYSGNFHMTRIFEVPKQDQAVGLEYPPLALGKAIEVLLKNET
jgi:hypothetical protein